MTISHILLRPRCNGRIPTHLILPAIQHKQWPRRHDLEFTAISPETIFDVRDKIFLFLEKLHLVLHCERQNGRQKGPFFAFQTHEPGVFISRRIAGRFSDIFKL